MGEWAAKGRRVGGMLISMLGAGLLLEGTAAWAIWPGVALFVLGAALFAVGFVSGPARR